jgi:hypothetical protein
MASSTAAVKQAAANVESSPGGLIDLVAKTLAEHAKVNNEKQMKRMSLEAEIGMKVAASSAALQSTNEALIAGIKTTRDIHESHSKSELKAAAALA